MTALFSLLSKEILRFRRVLVQTLLVPLVNASLYLLIFGVSLGNHIAVEGGLPYLAFLIPGLVMMGALNNAFQNSSSSIATSKFHGDLEDLRRVPLEPWQIVTALATGGLVRGLLVALVTFTVGEAFFVFTYGRLLPIVHPLALLSFLALGALSFALLGIAVAFRAKSIDQLSLVGGFVLLPLLYLGGVFFPLSALHPFWQTVSKGNPMLYFINGVRFGLLGSADLPWAVCLGFSVATLGLTYALAWRAAVRGPYSRW